MCVYEIDGEKVSGLGITLMELLTAIGQEHSQTGGGLAIK